VNLAICAWFARGIIGDTKVGLRVLVSVFVLWRKKGNLFGMNLVSCAEIMISNLEILKELGDRLLLNNLTLDAN
jgi:hypothetical protein